MELDDGLIYNGILRPNANEKCPENGYWPAPICQPENQPVKSWGNDWKQFYWDYWKEMGLKEEEIEAKFQAIQTERQAKKDARKVVISGQGKSPNRPRAGRSRRRP